MRSSRLLIGLALVAALGYVVFSKARDRARDSAASRRGMMMRGAIATVVGLVLSLWVPRYVTFASESPAGILPFLLLWIVGGGLAFVGIAHFLGAALAGDSGTP